ncbi:hypothetical protein CVT25_004946 [Psilocybe cyanescens]|uniref:BBC1/AIM3 cysteine proteinase-fold domain-containing protein n=1 Tax=Psilocybe cyanescens TaxID=93625 RepID=A0A409XTY4_PSICY|nr:hypothetical protein CVT25_004946 [Psilocybe cyanescens]
MSCPVAELKAKAAKASSSGVEKFQNVRDKNSSVPMKNTNWDPYSGNPAPPPPPPRSIVNRNTKPTLAPLPPPPSRSSSVAMSSVSRSDSLSPAPPLPSRGSSSSPAPQLPSRSKGPAPPPPPPRSSASALQNKSLSTGLPPPPPPTSAGPPPIVRTTRPGTQPRRVSPAVLAEDKIDWANLTPEDKQVFFDWLDEFFANFTPPTGGTKLNDTEEIARYDGPSHGPPPPIQAASKPTSWARPQAGIALRPNQSAFVLSHPPATTYGSSALDLAHYFAPTTHWTSAWYNSSSAPPIPPIIEGTTDHSYTSSWTSRGSSKTTNVGIFFSDLSVFWGTIEFTTTNSDPNQGTRDAVYLPRPKALGREELVEAHEVYGETIALFAESFLGSGEYCARGECWDLANEALKYFKDYDYIPKPVPSISRTHGHLIYEGKASNGGREMVGRWRGGDDRIRRGDIAEWRRVKIGIKGAPPGSFYTLGDPDHTAVIVSDSIPSSTPKDGVNLSPSDLGVIVVVEQSVGNPPKRTEYHLSCFQEGEMWIYRPISMKAYLGVSDITAVPPDGLQGLQRL